MFNHFCHSHDGQSVAAAAATVQWRAAPLSLDGAVKLSHATIDDVAVAEGDDGAGPYDAEALPNSKCFPND